MVNWTKPLLTKKQTGFVLLGFFIAWFIWLVASVEVPEEPKEEVKEQTYCDLLMIPYREYALSINAAEMSEEEFKPAKELFVELLAKNEGMTPEQLKELCPFFALQL